MRKPGCIVRRYARASTNCGANPAARGASAWYGSSTFADSRGDPGSAAEDQERVRAVLAVIKPRQAELLVLRSNGLSYDELASALDLKPASIGTFLSRAEQAFRKEYIKRYGHE